MQYINPKKFTYFIGIDVSRNELDIAVMSDKKFLFHKEIKNHPDDITVLLAELKTLPKFVLTRAIFCMEATGIYCNHVSKILKKFKANIVKENPLQIMNSFGKIRGKNDKIDAIRIANYAYKNRHELTFETNKRSIIEQLSYLSALRKRLVTTIKALKTPLNEQTTFIKENINKQVRSLCINSLNSLANDLEAVNMAILTIISEDERLNRINQIITSVPNVGSVTSLQIIITTNEFKDFKNPKKFACYAGVAPFMHESGIHQGKTRVSHLANKEVKALLHLCAIGAIRGNKEIKSYFLRKTQEEGKAKMSVVNAVRYKLILRIFSCVNQDRCYIKDYDRAMIKSYVGTPL